MNANNALAATSWVLVVAAASSPILLGIGAGTSLAKFIKNEKAPLGFKPDSYVREALRAVGIAFSTIIGSSVFIFSATKMNQIKNVNLSRLLATALLAFLATTILTSLTSYLTRPIPRQLAGSLQF
jgi:hypothetical protein